MIVCFVGVQEKSIKEEDENEEGKETKKQTPISNANAIIKL